MTRASPRRPYPAKPPNSSPPRMGTRHLTARETPAPKAQTTHVASDDQNDPEVPDAPGNHGQPAAHSVAHSGGPATHGAAHSVPDDASEHGNAPAHGHAHLTARETPATKRTLALQLTTRLNCRCRALRESRATGRAFLAARGITAPLIRSPATPANTAMLRRTARTRQAHLPTGDPAQRMMMVRRGPETRSTSRKAMPVLEIQTSSSWQKMAMLLPAPGYPPGVMQLGHLRPGIRMIMSPAMRRTLTMPMTHTI